MDRVRLSILAVSALLTTTIDPFLEGGHAADPAIQSSEETATSPPSGEAAADQIDRQVAEQILRRLSIRHTALPERERIALAQTILREARANDLDPHLVVAVIEVESGGYHLAVSRVGAMGLMQILPATGEELARRMDIEWNGPDTLFDPTINVRLGTAYLRQLADQFGNVNTALAAYNWGPGRIHRRLRRGASVPSRYVEQVMLAVDRYAMTEATRS